MESTLDAKTSAKIKAERLTLVYSDSWQSRLRGYVGRKYHNFGDWEGWFEEAHQNLAMKIDRLPAEKPLTDALIFAVFKNELISVKRNKLGYPRPRQWLREFSDLGQNLFEWMCLQRLTRGEIIGRAVKDSEKSEHNALVEKLVDMMIEKKECDGVRPMADNVDDESAEQLVAHDPSTEETADRMGLSAVLTMLLGDANTADVEATASSIVLEMRSALEANPILSDSDIFILRCYYFQGLSQNEIAKELDLPLHKVVRQREATVKRLREFMERFGLDRQSLL
ncbi:MAG: hypothetical protein KTR35_00175 [Gammaproteobacteria bacterium]|nr:hypothetical protein [Gammaproteobacteria bacterium]